MTFLEALKEARENTNTWFRPISWRKYGQAFAVTKRERISLIEEIILVPSSHGGLRAAFPEPGCFFEEWETTNAYIVNNENKHMED